MALRYTPVPGTWGTDDAPDASEWSHADSAFARHLAAHGFAADRPFYWSGTIDGALRIPFVPKRMKHPTWRTCGLQLAERLDRMDLADRNLICHSHGGQIALYAASFVPVNQVVNFMTPHRKDMLDTVRLARPNIRTWAHLYADRCDWMQMLGSLFDGGLGVFRQAVWKDGDRVLEADRQFEILGSGHSKVLNQPALFERLAPVLSWLQERAAGESHAV